MKEQKTKQNREWETIYDAKALVEGMRELADKYDAKFAVDAAMALNDFYARNSQLPKK